MSAEDFDSREAIAVLRAELVAIDRLLTERQTASERALELRLTATEKALDLASAETHRRLEGLNGEQARLLADRERFLSREVFDTWASDITKWRDEVNRNISITGGRDKGIGIAWATGAGVVGLLIAAASIVIAVATK